MARNYCARCGVHTMSDSHCPNCGSPSLKPVTASEGDHSTTAFAPELATPKAEPRAAPA